MDNVSFTEQRTNDNYNFTTSAGFNSGELKKYLVGSHFDIPSDLYELSEIGNSGMGLTSVDNLHCHFSDSFLIRLWLLDSENLENVESG